MKKHLISFIVVISLIINCFVAFAEDEVTIKVNPIDFVLYYSLPANDFEWTYDSIGERNGILLKKDSVLGNAFLSDSKFASRYQDVGNGYLKIMNGFYNVSYAGASFYFAFDSTGNLLTGFINTTYSTDCYNIDSETNKLYSIGSKEGAKYFLYRDGVIKGTVYNTPIVINNILYEFDLEGRVLNEERQGNVESVVIEKVSPKSNTLTADMLNESIGRVSGSDENRKPFSNLWEYDEVNGKWRYYTTDENGVKKYYTDGIYFIEDGLGGHNYIFDENGFMLTGYVEYKGNTYYLVEEGKYIGAMPN